MAKMIFIKFAFVKHDSYIVSIHTELHVFKAKAFLLFGLLQRIGDFLIYY
jgi:hypothetical protein